LYIDRVTCPKPVVFCGTALSDLKRFPESARREAGYQIDRLQHGLMPTDWKPISCAGPGVCEIRVRDAVGAYRVIYLARLQDAVYVLHCFTKKTQKTSQHDLELAQRRYRDLMKERP